MADEKRGKTPEIELTNTFNAALKNEIHNKEIGALMGFIDEENPDVLPGGMMGTQVSRLAVATRMEKKKRDKNFENFLLWKTTQDALNRLNEIIALQEKLLEELLEKINETQEMLDDLNDQYDALEEQREYFKKHGHFELDETGQLKNKEAEKILSDWEAKTGQSIDRSDPASYEIILTILIKIEEDRIQLRENIEDYTVEYEYRKQKLEEAIRIKEDLESGDPEKCRAALMDFRSLEQDLNKTTEGRYFKKSNALTKVDDTLKTMDMLSETSDSNIDFGFPPLKESFTKATSETIQPLMDKTIRNDAKVTVPDSMKPGG